MWVVVHDDWLKGVKKFTKLHAWLYIMSHHKKGKLESTLLEFSKEFGWSRPYVRQFLVDLGGKGLIEYKSKSVGFEIEIINYRDYPLPSHQTPVKKSKKIPISHITGKLPLKDLSSAENFAVFFYRNWIKRHPDNKKIKEADLKTWSDPFRLMLDTDGRNREEMVEVMKFVMQDDRFWADTILSPSGFRNNYDKIKPQYLKAKDGGVKPEKIIATGKWKETGV